MLHTFLSLLLVFTASASAAPPALVPIALNEDVPYITTPDNVTAAMLDLAAVKAGDHVIDLGSGDGRIVIAAARRGATGLGVEIDPRLVEESIANAKRAGVSGRAKFLEQDLFRTDLAPATVITMYLLPEVNLQLRPSILALRPGTRIVSHDWDMGDWKPDRSVTLAVPDKTIGLAKSSNVHLWIVPARVDGLWCGTQGQRRATLRLRQSHQLLSGEIGMDGKPPRPLSGRIDATSIALDDGAAGGELRLQWLPGELRPRDAGGAPGTGRGLSWKPAKSGAACEGGG